VLPLLLLLVPRSLLLRLLLGPISQLFRTNRSAIRAEREVDSATKSTTSELPSAPSAVPHIRKNARRGIRRTADDPPSNAIGPAHNPLM
jgi:hypothetical protein